jgi:hypothetical protein
MDPSGILFLIYYIASFLPPMATSEPGMLSLLGGQRKGGNWLGIDCSHAEKHTSLTIAVIKFILGLLML